MTLRHGMHVAASLAAAAFIGGTAAVGASASTTPSPSPSPTPAPITLSQLKQLCNAEVQRRLGTLGSDMQFVQQSGSLTSSDRSNLEGQIGADESGLTGLDQTIQNDTTLKQAREDCAKIVTNFRVYVLEDPKIHEVIAADGVSAVDQSFENLIPQLEQLIDASSQSQMVKEQEIDKLNDLRSKVSASETSISGVSASVINLQPSGYPGNKVVLQSAAQNIETSRDDLKGARDDVTDILQLLGS
ncbi:MAG: hypothetical protein JOY68_07325 [Candidatus Dormibacteraeota bacterium]|nr:hypothetical protein [Candidatus Dormibacteraeota bacterium]MBV8445096.1 hypothetical protein [Candidatus Dormibacteraeota bacterium]